ncbi:MAG: MMPL family transporter [Kofleriaceae bacterium]|nr:MMPL family transporter [Kofleriaceae bacterium]MCL4228337.1 MMPL family transporter [Myxococcales bacterium]
MSDVSTRRSERWVRWLLRHPLAVIVASGLSLLASIYLIVYHLPLRADFAALLPSDAPSVRDLRRLQDRVVAQDTVLVLVEARDPAARAAAAAAMTARARALPADLVSQVDDDDRELRDFLRTNLHLLAPLDELTRAKEALAQRIKAAKLAANPLYIDLDDDDEEAAAEAAAAEAAIEDLRGKWAEVKARFERSGFVSADGTLQLVVVRTAFNRTDVGRGDRLVAALAAERDRLERAYPGVEIGITGGVEETLIEHHALLRGVILSALITLLLVPAVLLLFFRSLRLFVILMVVLVVGTAASLGAAAITVGHLNAATAFLGAIVAGNGVNYGIFLIARYNTERLHLPAEQAMIVAVHGTVRPTLVASLAAVVAYGALAVTDFKGFADFAIIGSAGMPLCWIATYALVPILVLRFKPTPTRPSKELLGRFQGWLLGFRHPVVVLAAVAAVTAGGLWLSYGYVAHDPFEYDLRNLRADTPAADVSRAWLDRSDRAFGKGISGATFIAVDRHDQVPQVVAALRRIDAGKPPAEHVLGDIRSVLDLAPPDQAAKREVLAEIRRLLDDDALEALSDEERAQIAELRPPAELPTIVADELPPAVLGRLRERDDRVGLLISVRPGPATDEWNGKDLIRFAEAVRRIELPGGEVVTTSGSSVVFADIIEAIERDAPRVTLAAAAGLVILVMFIGGGARRSFATLMATAIGAVGLVATCAVIDLRVNFLDFVALPITLGLGVDYAINIAHPQGGAVNARQMLRSAGASVFVCSLTTMIGYGSLLVSENLAIRSFGIASLIGEVACVTSALIVVPALTLFRNGAHRHDTAAVA